MFWAEASLVFLFFTIFIQAHTSELNWKRYFVYERAKVKNSMQGAWPVYDDELKDHGACNYGKSFGFITQRASVLASTENTRDFSQGPFSVATSCGSQGSTQLWWEQAARSTPTQKLSKRDTAAPWTLLWQQDPLGSQAALLGWVTPLRCGAQELVHPHRKPEMFTWACRTCVLLGEHKQ